MDRPCQDTLSDTSEELASAAHRGKSKTQWRVIYSLSRQITFYQQSSKRYVSSLDDACHREAADRSPTFIVDLLQIRSVGHIESARRNVRIVHE